jgi:hypothetical protein
MIRKKKKKRKKASRQEGTSGEDDLSDGTDE